MNVSKSLGLVFTKLETQCRYNVFFPSILLLMPISGNYLHYISVSVNFHTRINYNVDTKSRKHKKIDSL